MLRSGLRWVNYKGIFLSILLTLNKKVSLESLYGIYLFLPVEDMVTKHIITFPKLDSDLFIEPASCEKKIIKVYAASS